MKILIALLCIFGCGVTSAFALARDMTIDFSWTESRLCSPLPSSPAFTVEHAPPGTQSLKFALTGPTGRDLGGANVALPANGAIPKGTVSFRSPCVGGMYTWTVEALDAGGNTLALATLARPFY